MQAEIWYSVMRYLHRCVRFGAFVTVLSMAIVIGASKHPLMPPSSLTTYPGETCASDCMECNSLCYKQMSDSARCFRQCYTLNKACCADLGGPVGDSQCGCKRLN